MDQYYEELEDRFDRQKEQEVVRRRKAQRKRQARSEARLRRMAWAHRGRV